MSNENRMPAEVKDGLTRCCICGRYTRNIHWHHTVPRALGGEDSLQIPLDGDCHTTLHAKAAAIVSKITGGSRKPILSYWENPAHEQMAETWIKILVDSMLNPVVDSSQKEILLPMIKVDTETRFALELLKRDLTGVTNLSQVLRHCIEYTLRSKGLKNESVNERTHQSSGKRKPNLW